MSAQDTEDILGAIEALVTQLAKVAEQVDEILALLKGHR